MSPKYHSKEEYESEGHGFVTIEEGARVLGMKQKAFDLLVAAHRDIFMRVMRYEKKWLIPDLYLEELAQNKDFFLVKAKYESLANTVGRIKRNLSGGHDEKRGPGQPQFQTGQARQTSSDTRVPSTPSSDLKLMLSSGGVGINS